MHLLLLQRRNADVDSVKLEDFSEAGLTELSGGHYSWVHKTKLRGEDVVLKVCRVFICLVSLENCFVPYVGTTSFVCVTPRGARGLYVRI